jgi:hypothetical protein
VISLRFGFRPSRLIGAPLMLLVEKLLLELFHFRPKY